MIQNLQFIIWNANPELLNWGLLNLRWYGLLFALGFILSQQMLYRIHKIENKPVNDVDTLTIYMVVATIIGARLGHVFFYEPDKYLADPIEILMINKGGLASHGAAVGILIALWIYSNYMIKFQGLKLKIKKLKRERQGYMEVLDRIVVLIAMTAVLIRVGNFINSEIEGNPTNSDYGVFFARNVTERLTGPNSAISEVSYAVNNERTPSKSGYQPINLILEFKKGYDEEIMRRYLEARVKNSLTSDYYISKQVYEPAERPLEYKLINDEGTWYGIVDTYSIVRHPTQLYEAGGYFLVFILLYMMWAAKKAETPKGRLFGVFLIALFDLRFLFEFIKENQVEFEDSLPLNMGQILSVPLVLAGIFILLRSYRQENSVSIKE